MTPFPFSEKSKKALQSRFEQPIVTEEEKVSGTFLMRNLKGKDSIDFSVNSMGVFEGGRNFVESVWAQV